MTVIGVVGSCVVSGAAIYGISIAIAHCFPSREMLAREAAQAADEKSRRSRFSRHLAAR